MSRLASAPHGGSYKFAFLSLIVLLAIGGCGRPPQIGAEKDAVKAVDALYTAVGLRDEKLIDECVTRLKNLRAEDKISEHALGSLESIVAETKAGKWESAQNRLIAFLDGQTR